MEKTRNTEEEKKMGQKWVKEEHKASTSRVNTGFPVNTGKLSPMMQEYCKTKEQYKDCILFYRLGDFYEMFLMMRCLSPKSWKSHLQEKTAD